jgi:hypothetical protein
MQLGNADASEGEWAVEAIETHAGAKENAVFLVKWKSGDKTWLPYYQITHLNALTEYFELQGIEKIDYLREGTGQPPKDDLQNYIGAVHLFRDCNYKRIPPIAHRPLPVPPSPHLRNHHVLSHQHPTPCLPRPSHPTCQSRVLPAAHERNTGRHSRWATTGIPLVRPGAEGRSSSFHPAIWVPAIRNTVQRASEHDRRLGPPRRCRCSSNHQLTYQPQPFQCRRRGPRGRTVFSPCGPCSRRREGRTAERHAVECCSTKCSEPPFGPAASGAEREVRGIGRQAGDSMPTYAQTTGGTNYGSAARYGNTASCCSAQSHHNYQSPCVNGGNSIRGESGRRVRRQRRFDFSGRRI